MKPLPLLLCGLLILSAGCQKTNTTQPATTPTPGSATVPTVDPNDTAIVYVAGYNIYNNTANYWRNGVQTVLPWPATPNLPRNYVPYYPYVSGLTLVDTNLYISGGMFTADTVRKVKGATAAYWLNGVATTLPDTAKVVQTFGVASSGMNLYVAGAVTYADSGVSVPYSAGASPFIYAKFGMVGITWTNGNPALLTNPLTYYSNVGFGQTVFNHHISGIAVNGGDVYMAGGVWQWTPGVSSSLHFTTYWKNGVMVDLPNRTTGSISTDTSGNNMPQTEAIAVSGSDVYVCGVQPVVTSVFAGGWSTISQAMLWKNGVLSYLAADNVQSEAYGLCISGGDVYVAGSLQQAGSARSNAVYWKNGVPVTLDSASIGSVAKYITVVGTNVYVAGTEGVSPVYWRNGRKTVLAAQGAVCGIAARVGK